MVKIVLVIFLEIILLTAPLIVILDISLAMHVLIRVSTKTQKEDYNYQERN